MDESINVMEFQATDAYSNFGRTRVVHISQMLSAVGGSHTYRIKPKNVELAL
jgi:hypothetical protein